MTTLDDMEAPPRWAEFILAGSLPRMGVPRWVDWLLAVFSRWMCKDPSFGKSPGEQC